MQGRDIMYQKIKMNLLFSKEVEVYLPVVLTSSVQIVYILDGHKLTPELLSFYENQPETLQPVLVSLPDENRINDYTPWPASSLVGHFPNFGGNGKEFIKWVEQEVKSAVEKNVSDTITNPINKIKSVLIGYSLGGLLAVYASYITDSFSKIVSISGSFWYPEWDNFLADNVPVNSQTKYLMLYGNKEGINKQTVQKEAINRSELTYRTLCEKTVPFPVFVDEGGHHDNVNERLKKAAQWIIEDVSNA